MKSQISQAIGWVVAVLIVFPLILFLSNRFFFSSNKNAGNYVKGYMEDSEKIDVIFPEYPGFTTTSKLYSTSITTPKENIFSIISYIPALHKYFSIQLFNYPDNYADMLSTIIGGKSIKMTVNRVDLNDRLLGTKEHPIPVFHFTGNEDLSVGSQSAPSGEINLDVTQKQFAYNVGQYLTYIISKEEFKRRFSKE